MLNKKSLLIFPTSRAIREYLYNFKNINTLLSSTLTIDEFFKKSISIQNYRYLQEEQRLILLYEAIKSVNIKSLGISSSFSKFLKQSDYIYRFFLELSSEKIDINSLQQADTYEFYGDHLEILSQVKKSYLEILEKNRYVDKTNLDKHYKVNEDFIKRFDEITIFFEGYFTKQEFDIIKDISSNTTLFIKFYSNRYNKKSLEIFKDFNYDFKEDYEYLINLSTKEIIEEKQTQVIKENLEIKGFSSRFNQVAFVKSKVVNLVNSGLKAENIAVVLPNEEFAQILELNDSEKYFNFAMGKSIANQKLFQKVKSVFKYINSVDEENISEIEYFGLNKDFIDKQIKSFWNKSIKKEDFEIIVNFFKYSENDKELLKKFDELIYRLKIIFFTNNNDLKLKDIYRIFLQNLEKLKLDDAHSGKITVMGLLETRCIKFDAVIICDFNSSCIPKISIKDKFLSTKVKFKASLPTRIDRENLQKYYYKRLINNSKNVFISYVNSNEDTISKFAYELFGNINISSNDEEYQDILYKTRKLNYMEQEIKDDIDLSKIVWSASSLKMFLECKRRWYFSKIMKLKEHTITKLPKSYELGNIIHSILKDYYEGEEKDIDKLFLKYRSENPFLILDLEVYKSKIKEFLDRDKEHLETRTIVGLEQNFNTTFNDIKITGVIDRVDKVGDFYEVIDYKTSKSLKVDTLKTYETSCDFQLEFYYIAVANLYNTKNIEAKYCDLFENCFKKEEFLEEKLSRLENIFEDIKEQSKERINFCKTENLQNCEFCPYKIICNI